MGAQFPQRRALRERAFQPAIVENRGQTPPQSKGSHQRRAEIRPREKSILRPFQFTTAPGGPWRLSRHNCERPLLAIMESGANMTQKKMICVARPAGPRPFAFLPIWVPRTVPPPESARFWAGPQFATPPKAFARRNKKKSERRDPSAPITRPGFETKPNYPLPTRPPRFDPFRPKKKQKTLHTATRNNRGPPGRPPAQRSVGPAAPGFGR